MGKDYKGMNEKDSIECFENALNEAEVKIKMMEEWHTKNETEFNKVIEEQREFLSVLSMMLIHSTSELTMVLLMDRKAREELTGHNLRILSLGYKLGYEAANAKRLFGEK